MYTATKLPLLKVDVTKKPLYKLWQFLQDAILYRLWQFIKKEIMCYKKCILQS